MNLNYSLTRKRLGHRLAYLCSATSSAATLPWLHLASCAALRVAPLFQFLTLTLCLTPNACRPLQDILALSPRYAQRPAAEETINDPTVSKHYWRYRLHVKLEELVADKELTGQLHELNHMAERC